MGRVGVGVLVVGCFGCGGGARVPAPPDPVVVGDVFGFDEVVESMAEGTQSAPQVAWDGTHFLVRRDLKDRIRGSIKNRFPGAQCPFVEHGSGQRFSGRHCKPQR